MSEDAVKNRTDIVYDGWISKVPKIFRPYLILMRADRAIGTWLLLLPCLWTLTVASQGAPDFFKFVLFSFGSFIMRGAGCVMNDLADRNLDGKVARTAKRPIPNGDVTVWQAIIFMGFLCLLGLVILWQFNVFTRYLGAASLLLVFIYPFCKRWTYWPQVVLGLTFNWGALLGWSAVYGDIALPAVCFYLAGLFWTLGYDTIYAHQDKDDDILIGIKSSALKLGNKTKPALAVFYTLTSLLVILGGYSANAGWLYFVSLCFPIGYLAYQVIRLDIDNPENCLELFKGSKTFGFLLLFSCLLLNAG